MHQPSAQIRWSGELPSAVSAPAEIQMAIDAYLLSKAGSSSDVFFRAYRMSPSAVTIGRHQRWDSVVDEEYCNARGWQWARRTTGGGALLHKDELNYMIVAPRGILAEQGPGEFRSVFDVIGRALSEVLRDLGYAPHLHIGERSEHLPQHGLCGRSITGNEIALDGRKIIAAAQLITPQGILQHGTIYLRAPDQSDQFWPSRDGGLGSDFSQRWADLGAAFAKRPWSELASLFERNFRRHFPSNCSSCELSAADWDSVESICDRWAASGWKFSR